MFCGVKTESNTASFAISIGAFDVATGVIDDNEIVALAPSENSAGLTTIAALGKFVEFVAVPFRYPAIWPLVPADGSHVIVIILHPTVLAVPKLMDAKLAL